jgi:3-methyladenine DNA glycosylase/8-oxoguanine DNA glycosylase
LRLVPPHDVDVVATVRSLREGGRFRFARDGVWWTTRTPSGPATVRIQPGGGLRAPVEVHAWGPGAESALGAVPALLGFHDHEGGFRPRRSELREQLRRHPGLRLGRVPSVIEALLPVIVAQKVPGRDAARSWRRLSRALAEPAPGPADLALPPDPTRLARLSYVDLHRFAIERKRAEPLLAACRLAGGFERLATRSAEQLMAGLRQVRGVGGWTVTKVARVVTGHPDVVVVGDYGLPALVAWNLAGERTADDARMLELLEPERPNRARAMQLILLTGASPPRHGPRLPPAAVHFAR